MIGLPLVALPEGECPPRSVDEGRHAERLHPVVKSVIDEDKEGVESGTSPLSHVDPLNIPISVDPAFSKIEVVPSRPTSPKGLFFSCLSQNCLIAQHCLFFPSFFEVHLCQKYIN